jgi:NAD(P)-dependent dehydrogenase (short-subunit alcohol dehydrogenase family)
MSTPKPLRAANQPSVTPDDVAECTRVLEALLADPLRVRAIPEAERIALMKAAGHLSQPTRVEKRRFEKMERRLARGESRERDKTQLASTQIRTLRRDPVFVAPPMLASGNPDPRRVLETPRACYVCKQDFRELHFFYDALCPECAALNYAKRFQQIPLDGKVALITGARVKIGYQAALMLLRSGARVIVTTRFPNDAAVRYSRETDFDSFKDRLHIHGLDLRHAPSVELFARHIEETHQRLDILINNAAQTVRRPPGFYAELFAREAQPVPAKARPLLEGHARWVAQMGGTDPTAFAMEQAWRIADPALGIRASAALSQIPYALEQQGDVQALFPQGRLDADLQQIDLRSVNTWRLTLSEVATSEMLEVHLVNAVAPFILCGKLKPLMLRNREEPGHIVNVSAMEGSFSRGTKTDKHPHTNMAKAALNMMTLTSAPDYAQSRIYMNAADTGWVTDEDPAVHAERKLNELDFQPPLDIVDGAARIIDPVFSAISSGDFVWGNFFKDYRPTKW